MANRVNASMARRALAANASASLSEIRVCTHQPASSKSAQLLSATPQSKRFSKRSIEEGGRVVSVYVHWPYCQSKCTYCDFNRYIREDVDHERMRKCLLAELEWSLELCGADSVRSVFFGGGTPTLAEPRTISDIIQCIQRKGLIASPDAIEVTMEANPTSSEAGKLSQFASAGINRLSIGVQAMSGAADLKFLGRNHGEAEAFSALDRARAIFPGRYSFDLIFGRPRQTLAGWREELHKALQYAGGHMSIYQLTLERGTPLYKLHQQGKLDLPHEELMADLYDVAVETLEQAGYSQYEVSNFAVPGSESKHNMAYWQGQDYIGIGPGAHSRHATQDGTRQGRIQTLLPEAWMREVEMQGHGTRSAKTLTPRERGAELLMLGLRTRQGVSTESWAAAMTSPTAPSLSSLIASDPNCRSLVEKRLLHIDPAGLRCTKDGLRVLDAILPELVLALERCGSPIDIKPPIRTNIVNS